MPPDSDRPWRSDVSKHRILLVLVTGLAGASACSWLEVSAGRGSVLFQDNFSSTASGWDRYQDSTYRSDYHQGAYRMQVLAVDTWAWSTAHVSLGDAQIHVDATKSEGPDNNVFGLVCRYQDWQNFVFFLASSDGYVGIGIRQDGENRLLSGESLQLRDVVLQGAATNHLRADCLGDRLELFVNGVSVAEAVSGEWTAGDVGLVVGSYEQAGVVVDFDNFSVLQP